MAGQLSFDILLLVCIIINGLQTTNSSFSRVNICSAITEIGNTVQLFRNKSIEPEGGCGCSVRASRPTCLDITVSKKIRSDFCSYPGINCTRRNTTTNEGCIGELHLRSTSDTPQGHIMSISVYQKNITINCGEIHSPAPGSKKHCNISMSTSKQNTSLICSQGIKAHSPSPSEALSCQQGTYINVTHIYIGTKGEGKKACEDSATRVTGNAEYCCEYEEHDHLFDAHCLKPLQDPDGQKQYDDLTKSIHECNNQTRCTVNDTILPIMNNNNIRRKYSSYFIAEYECLPYQPPQHNDERTQINFCENKTSTSIKYELKTAKLPIGSSCQCLIWSSKNVRIEEENGHLIAPNCSNKQGPCIEKGEGCLNLSQYSDQKCIDLQLISWFDVDNETLINIHNEDDNSTNITVKCWIETKSPGLHHDSDDEEGTTDSLPSFVIALLAAGAVVIITIIIVTAAVVNRKKRSSRNKPVYMTVERPNGQELQALATWNNKATTHGADGFHDIPLESDNELDPLYDQADQDGHVVVCGQKSRVTSSEGIYDHTNNPSVRRVLNEGSAIGITATTCVKDEEKDGTYDHAGSSRTERKADAVNSGVQGKLTGSSEEVEEDTYDHAGGTVQGHSAGPSAGKKEMVEGGLYGKLIHSDDVYDHATGQASKTTGDTESVSNTYGRLNMTSGEDGGVYNHTDNVEKKVNVLSEEYSTLNDA